MPRDGDPSLNIFVHFKQHVDSAVASGIHALFGRPQPPHQPPLPSTTSDMRQDKRQSELSISKSPDTPISDSSSQVTMDSVESHPQALDTVSVASWSYSPANLRHLRQPVPNDLPPQCDSTVFTFEDAFEDLLTVSQGQPLPDIKSKYNQRQLLRQMFSNGEPTWFWLRRLESQGLLRRPTRDELYRPRNFGLLEDSAEPEFSRSNWNDWSKLHEELDRKAAEVWKGVTSSEKPNGHANGGNFFDEIHQTFKQLEDGFYGRNRSRQEDHDSQHQKSLPDHFDDLFSSLSSSFAEGHKTWDAFVKSITDNKPVPTDNSASPPANSSEEKVYDNGNREVVTRDEKVNSFGYLTTTVTKKTYDKDGNEIGTETHFTMRPADKTQKAESKENSETNVIERAADADTDDQQAQDKKSGWFWK
ncbi:hypothetical protein TARUN_10003 [Trichoderma arundinaceum]|uniref:Uncharacterized protein n=1 Tax=Trichoderma arundinaceum TaxID=490622 RepID=A0A395N8B1_TRIAR|nr:hypothetical protein TARUN_10003 [Trichoderma arundinaceum]